MMKKLLVLLLFAVFCSGCNCNNHNIVLRFSTWGSASEMKIIKPIISEYERQNPNIKIELMHIPQDYFKKLHLLFASNLAPDIIFINNLNLPVYSKFLLPLNEYTNENEFFTQSIDAFKENDKILAIPRDISTLVIYYNKSIFDKYKVPYPSSDWSIEDLFSIAKKLTHHNVYGISYEPKIMYVLPYLRYFNGGVLNSSGSYIADSPESEKGFAFYNSLAYKYNIAPNNAQVGSRTLAQMFIEQKIAMHLSGRWLVPKYRSVINFDWDIINFPHYSAPSDASGWAVYKNSKYKNEAINFVMFLSSRKNIAKMSADGLIVPARKDVAYSDVFLSGKPYNSVVFLKSIQNSSITNVSKNFTKLSDMLNDTKLSHK